MCLIAFAWEASAEYPFALVANRDEFHARPTSALGWWPNTNIAAGRDLEAGGTWLGITTSGRFAAVTNVREGNVEQTARLSRGMLVTEVLETGKSLDEMEPQLIKMGEETAGFNLLYGDLFGASHELRFLSNRGADRTARSITSGLYAFSNAGLDDEWPKTIAAKQKLRRALRHRHRDGFWDVTSDRSVAEIEDLPDTGVEPDVERFLSAAFIVGENYGTRSTLRILGQPKSNIEMTERRYDQTGAITGSSQIRIERPATS